jgi:hypothetical protein
VVTQAYTLQHFSSMRQSILSSLETQLQEKWNDDYAQAWIEVFDFISRVGEDLRAVCTSCILVRVLC